MLTPKRSSENHNSGWEMKWELDTCQGESEGSGDSCPVDVSADSCPAGAPRLR